MLVYQDAFIRMRWITQVHTGIFDPNWVHPDGEKESGFFRVIENSDLGLAVRLVGR